ERGKGNDAIHRKYRASVSSAGKSKIMSRVTRREFLGQAIAASGSMAMAQQNTQQNTSSDIPRRPLGKTGLQASIIGMGGYHLGSADDLSTAKRMVDEAIDAGINFFDNAWDYHQC